MLGLFNEGKKKRLPPHSQENSQVVQGLNLEKERLTNTQALVDVNPGAEWCLVKRSSTVATVQVPSLSEGKQELTESNPHWSRNITVYTQEPQVSESRQPAL